MEHKINGTKYNKQDFMYNKDLTKQELGYVIRQSYSSIKDGKYTSYIHSPYQKTCRNIKKYDLDLKFYEDKENQKYTQYKHELKQKYEEEKK